MASKLMRAGRIMRSLAVCTVLALAGCGQDETEVAYDGPPLIVYSAYDDVDYLPALFKDFTAETGIPVVVRHRSDEDNLRDMQMKSGGAPADVLLSASLATIWTAADEGLLRPFSNESDAHEQPAHLRDPDDLWVAVSIDPVIVAAQKSHDADLGYAAVADSAYEGRLCLASSALPANRHLIAMLIETLGTRETELLVRRWVGNLALPPRESHAALLEDHREGRCEVFVSRYSALGASRDGVRLSGEPMFFDVEAVGIGRHAESPDAAERLIDWLLSAKVNERHAASQSVLPVTGDAPIVLSDRFIGSGGFRQDEAAALAERARYR